MALTKLLHPTVPAWPGDVLDEYRTTYARARKFYDEMAEDYALLVPEFDDHIRKLANKLAHSILSPAQQRSGRAIRVLDIASGTGDLLRELSSIRGDQMSYFGWDGSQNNVNIAKHRTQNGAAVEFSCRDWLTAHPTTPADTYDVVICTGNSLSHYSSTVRPWILQSFLSITAPDGVLVVDTLTNWKTLERKARIQARDLKISEAVARTAFIENIRSGDELKRTVHILSYQNSSTGLFTFKEMRTCQTTQYILTDSDLRGHFVGRPEYSVDPLGTWGKADQYSLFSMRRA